jgi:hypothetical protein
LAIAQFLQGLPLGLVADLRVNLHRHFHGSVSEELADGFGIGPGSDQVGGEGPSQGVDIDVFDETSFGIVGSSLDTGQRAAA